MKITITLIGLVVWKSYFISLKIGNRSTRIQITRYQQQKGEEDKNKNMANPLLNFLNSMPYILVHLDYKIKLIFAHVISLFLNEFLAYSFLLG